MFGSQQDAATFRGNSIDSDIEDETEKEAI